MLNPKKFNKLGKKKINTETSDIRSKFKKKKTEVLEEVYNRREEQSKSGTSGKSIFNRELMEKYNISEFYAQTGEFFFEVMPISFDSNQPDIVELSVHYRIGLMGDAFICMNRYNGKPCFICEEQKRMYKIHDGVTDEIKAMYPPDRVIYFFWDRSKELLNGDDPTYNFIVWAAPKKKIHKEIQAKARNRVTKQMLDISDISDDGDGRTLSFSCVKPKNSWPEYSGLDLLERDAPIPNEVLVALDKMITDANEAGYANLIEMLLQYPDYDEVRDSYLSGDTEDANDDSDIDNSNIPEKVSSEDQIIAHVEELQEKLEHMNNIKFKMWCKSNGYTLLANEDKEDAIEQIIEAEYDKLKAADDIPF